MTDPKAELRAAIVQERINHPQLTYREIAKRLMTNLTAVRDALKAERPDLLGRAANAQRRFDHAAAVEDYRTGVFSYDQLAEKYGVSHVSIWKAVKKADPNLAKTLPRKPRPQKFDAMAAYRDYCAGATMAEIARAYDVTSPAVSVRLNAIEPGVSIRVMTARARGQTVNPIV